MAKTTLLFRGRPLKQLTHGAKRSGGRNNHGRITSFHRGGGTKRSVRDIDLKRNIPDLTGTVERIEYDPFRTGRIALIRWDEERADGDGSGEIGSEEEGKLRWDKVYRIKDMQRRALPRGIHDVPRRALRSMVATICGVPVLPKKVREPVTVTIDGGRKFSTSAWGNGWRNVEILRGYQESIKLCPAGIIYLSSSLTEKANKVFLENRESVANIGWTNSMVVLRDEKTDKMETTIKKTEEVRRGIGALLV